MKRSSCAQRSFARRSLVSCDVEAKVVTNGARTIRRAGPIVPVWELMDRALMKGHGSPAVDVVAPLAGLLVLRWAAFMEAEQEAIASFNEVGFSPLLPEGLRQPAWGHDLSTRIVHAL